jgi:isoaspartyl peptidase/L-asparaginase-like protein (Ntn-hydrolase superfamily)
MDDRTLAAGAGTYANNASCAVSATSTGEHFIRNVVAAEICLRARCLGVPLRQAADELVELHVSSRERPRGLAEPGARHRSAGTPSAGR